MGIHCPKWELEFTCLLDQRKRLSDRSNNSLMYPCPSIIVKLRPYNITWGMAGALVEESFNLEAHDP